MVQNNPANINYGWRCYEGNEPYNLSGCPDEGLTFPVSTYSHYNSGDFKCSITGGYVYRGNQISGLNGVYFSLTIVAVKLDYFQKMRMMNGTCPLRFQI